MTEESRSDAQLDLEFDKKQREYANAVADCQAVSIAGAGREVDARLWWACVLFTRFCTTSISLLKVLPESPLEHSTPGRLRNPFDTHWDFTAVAVLARTLFENHVTLFYLCLDEVDEDESLSRLNLMQLHDHYSRKRTFGGPTPEEEPADRLVVEDLERKLLSKRFS